VISKYQRGRRGKRRREEGTGEEKEKQNQAIS